MNQDLRTLSTSNADNIDGIEGFLYVPDLPPSDPCSNTSTRYIPQNVTRLSDLKDVPKSVIALVPWMSPECMLSYLAVADKTQAAGFITYVPDSQTDIPPPVNDPQWGLNDGGQWKSATQLPVYAVPGAYGLAVMQQLPQYSGNLSTIGNSAQLISAGVDSTDIIRMYCNVQTSGKTSLPSLWAFLLIVLGVVLFLVACTSFAMHWYQRHARNQLRERVANGEIDLEALGIRRLTVPQEVLNKLPTYVYAADKQEPPINESPEAVHLARRNSSPSRLPAGTEGYVATDQSRYNQPTCAICLDDFVSHSTTVRELPCRHIYHPECIDQLLLRHSSLCPVCKTKVLPKGYCPQIITNLMVRRERQLRRLPSHGRVVADQTPGEGTAQATPERRLAVGGRMASFHRRFGRHGLSVAGRRISSAPVTSNSTELADRRPPVPAVNTNATTASGSPSHVAGDRRERARRRVSTLLGHQPMVEDQERESQQRLPKCKSLLFLRSAFHDF